MKKLIIMMVLVAGMAACTQETELSELEIAENEIRAKTNSASSLIQDERFSGAYLKAVRLLKSERERLSDGVDLSGLKHKDGVLMINSEKEFRPVYERVVHADTTWQNVYGSEIDKLVSLAKENGEYLELYGDGDEISWEVEDLLEADEIGFYDLQRNIAAKMPFRTLWAKAGNESREWLESQGENPEWEEDPDNNYIGGTYARLFINEESSMIIMDTVRYFDGETSFGRSDTGQTVARIQGAAGCRVMRTVTEFTDNTGAPTTLRARAYVNNFWMWKSYGVNGKGWIWRWGRWRERRFDKLLMQQGNVILQNGFANPCNPAAARNVNWNRTGNAVELSINRTIWGTNVSLAACIDNFRGGVFGRGRGEVAIMN